MSPTKEDLESLSWLGRFIGIWRMGDEDWDVGRSDDGYLRVWPRSGRAQMPLAEVFRDGIRFAGPPGPLGPRLAVLSQPLAQGWRTPEEYQRFKGPGRVTTIGAHATVVIQNPPAVKVSQGTSCGVLGE